HSPSPLARHTLILLTWLSTPSLTTCLRWSEENWSNTVRKSGGGKVRGSVRRYEGPVRRCEGAKVRVRRSEGRVAIPALMTAFTCRENCDSSLALFQFPSVF